MLKDTQTDTTLTDSVPTPAIPFPEVVAAEDGSCSWRELELPTGVVISDDIPGWRISLQLDDLDFFTPGSAEALAADLLRAAAYCREYREREALADRAVTFMTQMLSIEGGAL